MDRLPRVAFLLRHGLDHFAPDLLAALAAGGRVEPRGFHVEGDRSGLDAALAWTDDPARDALWFEFCWPPFPALIAASDFGGRRVVMRVHRIEAYGTEHAARAPWARIDDAIVVGADMAARLAHAAPALASTTRLHVVHNGLDLARYAPAAAFDPFAIGWCGALTLHKNPNLALEILHRLRAEEPRYRLRLAVKGGEAVAVDSFLHLARRLDLGEAVEIGHDLGQDAMPAWHAGNGVLLSTSHYESFGYAIAEAAAVGCDLAVLDNAAAGEFWPASCCFATVDEAIRIIRAAAPHRWRGLVADRFDVVRQAERVADLLLAPTPRVAAPPFRAAEYWERRYREGGASGAGSAGRLASFKAEVLNGFVAEHRIASVLEHGCGDGGQLALAEYPAYLGTDISETAVCLCRARFAGDPTKRFVVAGGHGLAPGELGLSLDVVFHLVEDDVFERYMRDLFDYATRYVIIYASDRDAATPDPHVRHRRFSDWVSRHRPRWSRIAEVPNRYRFDPAHPDTTSFADFHVFVA